MLDVMHAIDLATLLTSVDQEEIKELLEVALNNIETVLSDFQIEYAKSGASKCGICKSLIKKEDVRVGKKVYDTKMAKLNGPYDRWHHLECFSDNREKLEYYSDGNMILGFAILSSDDQVLVSSKIKDTRCSESCDEPESKKSKVVEGLDKEKDKN